MKLSLNQAAKECGRAKSTILEAIKKGHLSAPKNERGRYEIDPAELFRVFESTTPTEHREPAGPTTEYPPSAVLEAKIEAQEMIVARMEAEIADLRQQRDKWQSQAERQTLLLENMEKSQGRGLWGIFGRVR